VSSQEVFLNRVRRALRKDPVPPAVRQPLVQSHEEIAQNVATLRSRLATQRPALIAQLSEQLRAVGGSVQVAAAKAEAVAYIERLAVDKQAKFILRWQSELLETLEVDAALRQHSVQVQAATAPRLSHADTGAEANVAQARWTLRQLAAEADIGLSGADCAIAETGTLALAALPGQMRSVSLLPPIHIAVVKADQIVASLSDYLLLLRAAGADLQQHLTSCISFITGPSRTGDIELTLTVGVHGPGELHLVVLDET
jgi:L-lactate dehydrogenase complex protein LldG